MKTLHAYRVFLVLCCFAPATIVPGAAVAHGPKEVKLSYDASTRTLRADITHSPFSGGHYIEQLEIKKNGKPAAVQKYNAQPAETFTYTVKVDATTGDVLEVKAACSRFGSKTEKLIVGK